MLEIIFLQLQEGLITLDHELFKPFFDMQYFGCPDECIVKDTPQHIYLNFFVTPIVWIIVGIGIGIGLAKRFGKLKLPKRKPKEKIRTDDYASRIVQKQRKLSHEQELVQEERNRKKQEKKEFLSSGLKTNLNNLKTPEQQFEDFISQQDPEHPQADVLHSVRATTKEEEITPPEQKVLNKIQEQEGLKKQEKDVEELMKKENISEDEAVDRILKETYIDQVPFNVSEDFEEDVDIFKQDVPPKKYPKVFKRFQKKLKKKEQPKVIFKLNDLGKTRRDQYAEQIEKKLLHWAFPIPEYNGHVKEFQLGQDEILVGMKKLSLFLSMGEFMQDRKRRKKRYWETIKLG